MPHQLRLRRVNHIAFRQLTLEPVVERVQVLSFIGDQFTLAQMLIHDSKALPVNVESSIPCRASRSQDIDNI